MLVTLRPALSVYGKHMLLLHIAEVSNEELVPSSPNLKMRRACRGKPVVICWYSSTINTVVCSIHRWVIKTLASPAHELQAGAR